MRLRWRIRQKLTAGLLVVVAMTAALSAGAFYGLYSYRHSNKVFNYYHQQLAVLGYLELTVSELTVVGLNATAGGVDAPVTENSAVEGKLERLKRVEKMIANYRNGLENAVDHALTDEAAHSQFADLDELRAKVDQLVGIAMGTQPMAVAMAPSAMGPWWVSKKERDIIAQLIENVGRLRGSVHAEITRHVEADRTNYRASLAVVYATTVMVIFLLVVLIWLGYKTVFSPIRELHRGVTRLAGVNFDSRVQLQTGDEMQELGEAFNDMAARLHGIYKDLNRQVEERSRQLIRSERLASVGFLAAGVAHEINNPLASIAFCSEALETRIAPLARSSGDEQDVIQNYLHMIQQEAFRCKAITEKLLDFSRVGEPERVETDLAPLVRSVIEMVQHLGRVKDKNIIFDPAESVWARVNAQELKQVLLNLVVNALESVDEGGWVEIEVSQMPNGQAEIKVRDNGCGMDAEVMENLFEPFFTRNRTGKGTGLGLSISHLIVSQHGGTLDASSPGVGRGSTFTVRLPMQTQAASASHLRAA